MQWMHLRTIWYDANSFPESECFSHSAKKVSGMEETENDDSVEVLLEEFFTSDTKPVTNHEEWLLRLCASLMKQKAEIVAQTSDYQRQIAQHRSHNARRRHDQRRNKKNT